MLFVFNHAIPSRGSCGIIQKLLRVKQIEENDGVTVVSEGVEANYHDMVNYAIFALIHLKG